MHVIVGIIVALGCGLLVGIEREMRKGSGPHRALAGVRTFALAAIAGSVAQALQQPWLIVIGALMILTLGAIAYWRERSDDPGITTEIALFITYMLGVAAIDFPLLSAGVSVAVAGLLAARNSLHYFSSKVLSETELRDGLYLAAAALIVLPLIPNQTIVWMAGVNPRRMWGLVVLLMFLQAGGYVALRVAGAKLGLALSGLASGFVSSTATVVAMGARAHQDPELRQVCISGALFSNVATFVLLIIVTIAIYPRSLVQLTPLLLTGLLTALIVAGISFQFGSAGSSNEHSNGRAFSLIQAVGFAVILSAVTVAIAFVKSYFGNIGVSVVSTLAGLVDVHAVAASVLSLNVDSAPVPTDVRLPILLVISSNTASKVIGAFASGGIEFGLRVGAGLVAILVSLWACFLIF